MAVSYTASVWTVITSSANIPTFNPSTYTLKGNITDNNHKAPGNPFTYPTNLSAGQNLYTVFTAPSGATEIQRLCVSMSFREVFSGCSGLNPYTVTAHLRSGSCAASGSAIWNGIFSINVFYQAIDSNNNYYYGDVEIFNGQSSSAAQCIDVINPNSLVSVTAEIVNNVDVNYVIDPCATCGIPDQLYFDNEYAVVSPSSITSSTFPAQILNISGGNYGVKISSSVDGQLANVDIGIGWVSSSNTPRYYTGSFGGVYYSNQISASVQRNNCPSGEAGSYVLYTLPVSYSSATSSQADAQTTAQAYFNSTSQSYANTYGTCSPTGSTMSIYAKYVSLAAELEYNVNNTGWVSLGTINTSTCTFVTTVTALTPGDSVEFRCVGSKVLSVSTTTCPASANQCADYQFLAGGANTFYITVNGALTC